MIQSNFDGKWALVLGSSSGFGEAATLELARSGLNIFGVHMDRKAGQAHADEIVAKVKAMGRQVLFFNMNAADELKRQETVKVIQEKAKGRLHVLLHSLAFGALKPMIAEGGDPASSLTKAQIEMTIDVMASSLVYWTQDLVNAGCFGKTGRIYAMTSAGSSRQWKSYGAVSAAKAALESYCRQLAVELAPMGITANAILAGVTDTPALRKIPGNDAMIETAKGRNPFKRLTTPEDIATSLVALSLPHCDFITGNTIRIDGGENVVD
jgi:enoyl-[acyl-carrier protein] reductase III